MSVDNVLIFFLKISWKILLYCLTRLYTFDMNTFNSSQIYPSLDLICLFNKDNSLGLT